MGLQHGYEYFSIRLPHWGCFVFPCPISWPIPMILHTYLIDLQVLCTPLPVVGKNSQFIVGDCFPLCMGNQPEGGGVIVG